MAVGWKSPKCTYRPNRHFVGRDGLLEDIHKSLCEGPARTEPQTCMLLGLAGIGKTQTAIEYCYRYSENYDWQFWIPAGSDEALLAAFRGVADRMPASERVSEDAVGDVIAWLETTADSWIIVFDNVEDWPSVHNYIPRRCSGQSGILLTSQLTALASEADHVFPLKSLSIPEGARLLGRHVYGVSTPNPEEYEAALQISRRFAAFPLSLAHIGGFINESSSSIERYEKTFDARHEVSWKGMTHATTTQYGKPMESVWAFALSDGQLSANSRQLLKVLSFLDPDCIPEGMILESFIADPASWGLKAGSERAELWDMRRSLRKRSLVSIGCDDVFTMQRSLQHSILLQLDQEPGVRSAIFHQAFEVIRLATPKPSVKQIPNPKLWPQSNKVTPHIVSLCRNFSQSVPPMQGTLEFAQLLYYGGFFLWERQDYSTTGDAVLILSTSLKILNDVCYSTRGQLRADILAIMGMFYDQLGPSKYEEALEMRENARDIRQFIKNQEVRDDNVTPAADTLLYNSLNDEGIAQMQLNRFHEAEKLFTVCLRKYQTWGPEENVPFEYAKYNHNMGLVRMCQGRFPEAVKSLKKSVQLEELYEGSKSSPLISLFAYDLACALFHAGDVESALAMHLEILSERETPPWGCSQMALLSCYTVGAMYHHMGELEKAEQYIKKCIDRANDAECERWPDYARGRAHMHLAKVMRERSAAVEDIKPIEDIGNGILADYKDDALKHIPITDDDMDLYDALQPVLYGRYTGRGLVPLLQTMTVGWTEDFNAAGSPVSSACTHDTAPLFARID